MLFPVRDHKEEDETILNLIRNERTSDEGFRLLIRKYQERLYYHIRNLVKTHEDTDDVLQNVFVKIFKNIGGFQENSSLFTWMYRIATNESLNFLEKQQRDIDKMDIVRKNHVPGIQSEEIPDAQKIKDYVDMAIMALPDKQRLVFHLRYFEELSYEEISAITQTTIGALKASYHHAVKKIETVIINNYSGL